MAAVVTPLSCKQFRRLIRRNERGTLSGTQQERYNEHFDSCSGCRFAQITPADDEESPLDNRLLFLESLSGQRLR